MTIAHNLIVFGIIVSNPCVRLNKKDWMRFGLHPHPAVKGGLLCAKQLNDYLQVIQCELLLSKISQDLPFLYFPAFRSITISSYCLEIPIFR